MKNRVKLFELAPGIQAVAIVEEINLKRLPPLKGYQRKPIIGCLIYVDEKADKEYINLAAKFTFNDEQERDQAFSELSVTHLIAKYNQAVTKKNYGIPVLALPSEEGNIVPMAFHADDRNTKENDKKNN